MAKEKVSYFQPYLFHVGQKIHIMSGPRSGDWLVTGIGEKKVRLRCPVSLKEYEWDLFCYHVEDKQGVEWPQKD